METQTPAPPTTVRRNPPRRAKHTPFPPASPPPSAADLGITPFPLDDLLRPDPPPKLAAAPDASSQSLKVFLRVRPLEMRARPLSPAAASGGGGGGAARRRGKVASPKKGRRSSKNISLVVNDSNSVTVSAPASSNDSKRAKREVYDGFSFVFPPESSQKEIYDRVMYPLVTDFLGGKGALLAAMGPTGSGKTHTMFGSQRDPGMVPLALRQIFSHSSESSASNSSRSYYLSMFEINSERGKGERVLDLSPDGVDLSLQQSSVKGLQEVMVSSITQAECLVARAMLKRATAMTNANHQSSRSQCIINIRSAQHDSVGEKQILQGNAVLTIADLAGAERERKTGNQGVRLLESSFINNTSMVLGQCLRSLLEHQKNPKKPLQKHYKNSMLTRYLKEYLEGKRRMTLILTVKPGEDDYMDTSFLLRQASPYMRIKFSVAEDFPNVSYLKRSTTCARKEQIKRRKVNDSNAPLADGGKDDNDSVIEQKVSEKEHLKTVDTDEPLNDYHSIERQRMVRNEQVMQKFAKAMWNVLKEYKQKLKVSEDEVQSLKGILNNKTIHVAKLEKELMELKSRCLCYKYPSLEESSCCEVDTVSNHSETEPPVSPPSQSAIENVDEGGAVSNHSEPEAPVASTCQSTLGNINVAHDGNLYSATDHQIRGSHIITGDCPEVEVLGLNVISVDSDLTGPLEENRGTVFSSLENYESTLVANEQKDQISENFSGSEDISKNLEPLNDFVITEVSLNSNSKDLDSFSSTLEVKGSADSRSLLEHSNSTTEKLETSDTVETGISLSAMERSSHEFGYQDHKDFVGERDSKGSTAGSTHSDPAAVSIHLHSKLQDVESTFSAPIEHRMSAREKLPKSHASLVEQVGQNDKSESRKPKEHDSASKAFNARKSKRRLLPQSAMLLKEFSVVDMEAEIPKENRGKPTADAKGRTQGSISLVRLLKNNCQ